MARLILFNDPRLGEFVVIETDQLSDQQLEEEYGSKPRDIVTICSDDEVGSFPCDRPLNV